MGTILTAGTDGILCWFNPLGRDPVCKLVLKVRKSFFLIEKGQIFDCVLDVTGLIDHEMQLTMLFFVDKILKTTSICYNFTSHGGTKYIHIIFIKHEQYYRSDLQQKIFWMYGRNSRTARKIFSRATNDWFLISMHILCPFLFQGIQFLSVDALPSGKHVVLGTREGQ